jgi:hypothetical protein
VPSKYVHKRECESERENDRMGERMGAESVDEVSECEGEQEKEREKEKRENNRTLTVQEEMSLRDGTAAEFVFDGVGEGGGAAPPGGGGGGAICVYLSNASSVSPSMSLGSEIDATRPMVHTPRDTQTSHTTQQER